MKRTHVTFDGMDLTSLFLVSDLGDPLLPRAIATKEVPGRDGAVYVGATLQPRTVTLRLTVLGKTLDERRAAAHMLADILCKSEPAPLCLSSDDGLYYMAVAKSDDDGALARNATSYVVEFLATDPVAYGRERTVTVPSGGSATFDVGGTYPTMPRIRADAASNAAGGFWRLRMEDGSYVLATIPSGVSTAKVDVDCASRVLRVGGSVKLMDALADWLEFGPGRHTIEMTGSGLATVTYVERWV